VEVLRRRVVRGMLATLLLSSGVPMLLGGDEFGRTQGGNNNAYCQDNEISWYDWDLQPWQHDLADTTAFLTRLRAAHPVLRQRDFFPGDPIAGDALAALHWHAASGSIMTAEQWSDGGTRTVQAVFDGSDVGDDQILLVLHAASDAADVTLPASLTGSAWALVWDSAYEQPAQVPSQTVSPGATYPLRPASLAVFRSPSTGLDET
jgi:glycogen operon protein